MQLSTHGFLHLCPVRDGPAVENILTTNVRGHENDDVAEIGRAPWGIGQPAIVGDLQENVEYIRVRLLTILYF